MEGGAEVEGDDQVPFLDRELVDRRDMLGAGIVDQDVDRAELFGGAADHRLDRLGPGQVGVAIAGADASGLDLRAHGLDLRRVAEAVEHHVRAFGRERAGDGEADAGGGAGDERGLALEKHELPFNSGATPFRARGVDMQPRASADHWSG